MTTVLVVIAVWIALDIAIIGVLSHLSARRPGHTGPRPLERPLALVGGPAPAPARLRVLGDPSTTVPDRRLRAVSNR